MNIQYVGGPEPQGSYLLVSDVDGRFPLKSISRDRNLPDVKFEGIIPALVKEYPLLTGRITVSPFEVKMADLIEAGEVQISGHVKNPGKYPADTLGVCMTKAAPTEFGSIRRVQVISGRKTSLYDMSQREFAEIKLRPGDIVFVPMKRVLGN